MDIYLIRHGATNANALQRNQSTTEPLSAAGREQAKKTGERLRSLGITYLVTSDYTRAADTAGIIGEALSLEPAVNEHFREIKRPDSLFGRSHYSPATVLFVARSMLHRRDPRWRYGNAENLYEIEARAQKARGYLRELSHSHGSVAVVSHAVFIEVLTSFMCKEGSVFSYLPIFSPFSRLKNCSITEIGYEPRAQKNVCPWTLISFGDIEHLKS